MRWFITLILLLTSALCFANSDCTEAEEVYGEILKFDYCRSVQEWPEGSLGYSLLSLLCHQYQLEQVQINRPVESSCDSVLFLLIQGYDSLYARPATVSSLEKFMQAYALSQSLDGKVHRLVLSSILSFYSRLPYSDQQNQLEYLKEFRQGKLSPLEESMAMYNETDLWGSSMQKKAWDSLRVTASRFESVLRPIDKNLPVHLLSKSVNALMAEFDGQLAKAEKSQLQIIEDSQGKPFLNFLRQRAIHRLVFIKTRQRRYKAAERYIDSLQNFSTTTDSNRILWAVHRRRAAVYDSLGQSDKALDQLNRSFEFLFKTNYQSLGLQTAVKEIELNTIRKERAFLQSQNELERVQRLRTTYLALALLLGLAVLIVLYRLRVNALEKQQIASALEYEHQRSQLDAINARVDGEEAQRFKIAEYLHDQVAGSLAALKVHLDISERGNGDAMEKPRQLLEEVGSDVRRLSHELFPSVLIHRSLEDALDQLCEKYSNAKLRIAFVNQASAIVLSQESKVKLYFVVKELLNNVVKHSGAEDAMVKLSESDDNVFIQVRDDGDGIREVHTEGMGLGMIRARILSLDGHLDVDGIEGCTITARIPKSALVKSL